MLLLIYILALAYNTLYHDGCHVGIVPITCEQLFVGIDKKKNSGEDIECQVCHIEGNGVGLVCHLCHLCTCVGHIQYVGDL